VQEAKKKLYKEENCVYNSTNIGRDFHSHRRRRTVHVAYMQA